MDYTNLVYNVNGGNLVNEKMTRIKEFEKLLITI